ncbi:hypothetical protein K1719_027964 [Acacia pycnantha]|nr:hypothetical protein K1719_027964 [Acacia pycnantha]
MNGSFGALAVNWDLLYSIYICIPKFDKASFRVMWRGNDVGCEISKDLSECGLVLGIKQPKLESIFPDRAYAFFSHTHKDQKENMPLLDKGNDQSVHISKRVFQVYGCVVTAQDMVEPKDPTKPFDKARLWCPCLDLVAQLDS